MARIPTNRTPTHPGEMLRDEFLVPMNISQRDLADAIHVPYQWIDRLLRNVMSAGKTRQKSTKKRSLLGVNEHFKEIFNAGLPSGIVFQQPANEIVNQKRGVTPSTALSLAKFFGLSADFWLKLQIRWDLYNAQAVEKNDLDSIQHFQDLQKIA